MRSSDGSKEYRETWDDEGRYRSNDNATFWQGYAGYPVIMALMLQGRVPFNGEVAAWFKGIPWKALNDAHKRDYAAALAEAFERAGYASVPFSADADVYLVNTCTVTGTGKPWKPPRR